MSDEDRGGQVWQGNRERENFGGLQLIIKKTLGHTACMTATWLLFSLETGETSEAAEMVGSNWGLDPASWNRVA